MLLLVRWIRTYNGIQFDWSVRTILSSTIQIYLKKEKENSSCPSSPSKRNNIHLVISSPNEVQNSSIRILYREINHTRIHYIIYSRQSVLTRRIDSSLQIRSSPLREREGGRASLSSNLYKSGFIIFRFGGCLSAPNVFLTLYHHASILPWMAASLSSAEIRGDRSYNWIPLWESWSPASRSFVPPYAACVFTRMAPRVYQPTHSRPVYFSHRLAVVPTLLERGRVFSSTNSSLPIPPRFGIYTHTRACTYVHTCFWIPIHASSVM